MNAKHPIDELFARELSDAEVTPPPAVWEGISRQRGWGHRTLLRLQHRWGFLGLLLLLAGTGAATWYLSDLPLAPSATAATSHTLSAPPNTALALANTATEGQPLHNAPAASSPSNEAPSNAAPTIDAPGTVPAGTSTTAPSHPTANNAQPSAPASSARSATPDPAPVNTRSHTNTTARNTPATHTASVNTLGLGDKGSETGPVTTGRAATPAVSNSATTAVVDRSSNSNAPAAPTAATWDGYAHWLPSLPVLLEPNVVPGQMAPGRTIEPLRLSKGSWCVGLSLGMYAEKRTWKGNDLELVNGLNDTETPHYPYGIGLSFGRQWHSGLQAFVGVEYAVGRFDLTHTERTEQWTEVTTPGIVVLLDSMVVASTNDTTYLTLTERELQTTARNTITTFRIPVEVGYSIGCGRWDIGLRGGPVLEFVRSRSGYTLDLLTTDGTSVYQLPIDRERTSTIIGATLTPWVGFRLTEHLQLSAEGAYMRGLGTFGGQDAYVVPERFGARLRLSYTLPRH